jgi:hypothetical protein
MQQELWDCGYYDDSDDEDETDIGAAYWTNRGYK